MAELDQAFEEGVHVALREVAALRQAGGGGVTIGNGMTIPQWLATIGGKLDAKEFGTVAGSVRQALTPRYAVAKIEDVVSQIETELTESGQTT
tara:strand:- start:8772 stop:9050 length:279 start_codon:yes stop_codon:yes gene_type:complete